MDTEVLDRRLAAAQKTIDALMRRVEAQVGDGTTAFAIMEQNVALERVVLERTRALEAQRSQLQLVVADLKQAQVELLQAQKLESVGRLASGVAHEINTPIQFVADSVRFVRDACLDVVPVFQAYRRLLEVAAQGPVPRELLCQAEAVAAAADLQYVTDNVPQALERATEGLERVAAIIRALKEFAHPDPRQFEPCDLNHAIETTLVIARHEYKYVADVETDLGPIPPVPCLAGELKQVFLNLIVNAAHAIADVRQGVGRGRIDVATRLEGDRVVVSIRDDGAGIPPEIRGRIFDPFFTTKAVGKGSGQGLSIARSVVVEKHRGTLTFETQVGRGTVFHVRLPVDAPAAEARP